MRRATARTWLTCQAYVEGVEGNLAIAEWAGKESAAASLQVRPPSLHSWSGITEEKQVAWRVRMQDQFDCSSMVPSTVI